MNRKRFLDRGPSRNPLCTLCWMPVDRRAIGRHLRHHDGLDYARPLYFDRRGRPLGLFEWAELFEDFAYRLVATINLPNGYQVSTIWMGNNLGSSERPVTYESMVFDNRNLRWLTEGLTAGHISPDSVTCERYASEGEARAGHAALVAEWRQKLNPRPAQ